MIALLIILLIISLASVALVFTGKFVGAPGASQAVYLVALLLVVLVFVIAGVTGWLTQ